MNLLRALVYNGGPGSGRHKGYGNKSGGGITGYAGGVPPVHPSDLVSTYGNAIMSHGPNHEGHSEVEEGGMHKAAAASKLAHEASAHAEDKGTKAAHMAAASAHEHAAEVHFTMGNENKGERHQDIAHGHRKDADRAPW